MKKVLISTIVGVVFSLTACGTTTLDITESVVDTEPDVVLTDPVEEEITYSSSTMSVKNTEWQAGDGSLMNFNDGDFIWYAPDSTDTYYYGTYDFYSGSEALEVLTTDLADYSVTAEEMQGYFDRDNGYYEENFVVLILHNNGLVQVDEDSPYDEPYDTPYYGFALEDNTYLDLANMNTANYAAFTLVE